MKSIIYKIFLILDNFKHEIIKIKYINLKKTHINPKTCSQTVYNISIVFLTL